MQQVLSTKLHIPTFHKTPVNRPELINRLNEGLNRKLILVSAPAGFGKTTVVSNWIAQCEAPTIWLSLDERDNDPIRFLTYMITALQLIEEDIGDWVIEALESSQQPSFEAILTLLVNEIAVVSNDFYFVLDDYHLIDSQEIDTGLAFLLSHMPQQMHLIIISREDPQLPLSRLRVRDQLTELRVADLRFTLDEATEFLNTGMGLTLSAKDIDLLEKRTEGWVAGLQLAALSLQGRADVTDFIRAFKGSHRFIVDYLLDEVLERQPIELREFLLDTSILEQLNGSLCDALLERDDSQKILEGLERNNLFLIPLDEERGWYRYHHLFGDALRNTLATDYPDRLQTLHRRASHWYSAQNQSQEAIHHAIIAKDFHYAADLIEEIWPIMDGNYQSDQWFKSARHLPKEIIVNRPILCLGYGWVKMLRSDLKAAEGWFQKAERWIDAPREADQQAIYVDQIQFQELAASVSHAYGYRALMLGDIETAEHLAKQAFHHNQHQDHVNYMRSLALQGLTCLARGDLVKADQIFSKLIERMRREGQVGVAAELVFLAGEARWTLGKIRHAFDLYQDIFQSLSYMENSSLISVDDLHRGIVDFYREWGEWDKAEDHLMAAQEQSALASGRLDWQHRLNLTAARLYLSQGKLEIALDFANRAVSHYRQSPIPPVRTAYAVRALIWIRQGNLDNASRWAYESRLHADDTLTYLNTFNYFIFARLLIAQGDFNQAETILNRLNQVAQDGRRTAHIIEALMLMALVYDAQQKEMQTMQTLNEALALAEPIGYLRLFLDEGTPMILLLERVSHESTYAKRLLAANNTKTAPLLNAQPLIDSLSERELEVLRLLTTELTGPEIARQLVMSLSTMRTHTRSIYRKLDVNSRRAAIRKAQDMSLI